LHAVPTVFHATTREAGRKTACVYALGNLDGAAAPPLERALRQALRRGRTVVLDLRGLTRADTAGVRVIVEASAAGRRAGARLILVRGLSQVDRLLALTGTSGEVEMVDLALGEPALQALLHIARIDRARVRAQGRRAGLVQFACNRQVTHTNQITRGVDALIAGAVRGEIIEP
jgi:anti-anti-sigma factor